MLQSPTLTGKTDYQVVRAIGNLVTYVNQLEAQIATLQRQVAAIPPPLSLQQISKGLSASGAAPLSLTGLTGTPATP